MSVRERILIHKRNEATIKHPISNTTHGALVYVDLITSPASTAISQNPHLIHLIKDLLKSARISGKTVAIEYDFGRNVGNTDIVKTSEKDAVFYAKRWKHDSFAPFVRRRAPMPSTCISIVLQLDSEGEYELRDTWFGRLAPPLPGTETETGDSKEYWLQHALVFEGQPVQMRTLTRTCPY